MGILSCSFTIQSVRIVMHIKAERKRNESDSDDSSSYALLLLSLNIKGRARNI